MIIRIKEIIITAGGENVAPTNIEEEIKSELPEVKKKCCQLQLKIKNKYKHNQSRKYQVSQLADCKQRDGCGGQEEVSHLSRHSQGAKCSNIKCFNQIKGIQKHVLKVARQLSVVKATQAFWWRIV